MKNKSYKKYLSATIAAAVVTSGAVVATPNAEAASFPDVQSSDYFYEAVKSLTERGIIKGFPDGTFKPYQNVTRGQAAKIIAGALGLDTANVKNPGFSDVSTTNEYYGAISALANAGIINGYPDGTFKPNAPVQRNHMAKIIATAFNLEPSSNVTTPFTDLNIKEYDGYITALYELGITTGNTPTTFGGTSNVTRGQLVTFVARAESTKETQISTFTIESVSSDKVQTSEGTLTFDPSLNYIFRPANAKALKDAEIKATVVNGEISSVTSITINANGTKDKLVEFYGGKNALNGNIIVNGDYVAIKNITIDGNVTLNNKVKNSFSSEALTINGTLTVANDNSKVASTQFFAATNSNVSISLKESSVKSVIVQRNDVSITSDTKIPEVQVADIVTSIELNSDVEKLTIQTNSQIVVNGKGKVSEFVISDKNAKIELGKDVKVAKLVIPEGLKVTDVISNYDSVASNIDSVVSDSGTTVDKPSRSGGSSGNGGYIPGPSNNVPAEIIYDGPKQITVEYGGTIPEINVKAKSEKSTLTKEIRDPNGVVVNAIDTTKPGTYTIIYTVTSESDKATLEIYVNVLGQFIPQQLKVSSYTFNINEVKPFKFQVNYNGKKPADDKLFLLKKTGENQYEEFKDASNQPIYLFDNGEQDINNDLLLGDGVYNNEVDILVSDPGEIKLVAGVKEGNEWKEVSTTTTILALEPMTSEDAAKIVSINNSVQSTIESLKEKPKEEIVQKVVELLNNSEDITEVSTSDSADFVWYALKSGALGAITIPTVNSQEGNLVGMNSISLDPFAIKLLSDNGDSTSITAGNQRVVIYATSQDSAGVDLAHELAQNEKIPFTVDKFVGEEASVEQFKNMFSYGTIIFDTNGAVLFGEDFFNAIKGTNEFSYLSKLFNEEQVVIVTGEKVTEKSLQDYNGDLKTGRLVIVDDYYAITPAFIEFYGGLEEFQNSLVYANSPYSLANDTLATQFTNAKAAAFVGVKETTSPDTIKFVFNDLINEESLEQAISGYESEIGIKGAKSFKYTKEIPLANGNLENGKKPWISGGHFDTISQLGLNEHKDWTTPKPVEGSLMGIISSGVDDSALGGRQSWVYQTFTVPNNVNTLKFDYNVVSNEPFEYVNSIFDDKFKATIVEGKVKEPQGSEVLGNSWLESTIDENETIIAFESINSSDWGIGNERRVDAIFPEGDKTIYMTGWKTLSYDITKYQGKTITLKLQTWDEGDSAFPTAVLFDNVRLTNSEIKGLGITGVKNAVIPYSGKRKYQLNAVPVDQFNHPITGEITLIKDNYLVGYGDKYDQPKIKQHGKFSLKSKVQGVSINPDTGLLTISSETKAESITVIADGEHGKAEHTIQLHKQTKEDYEHDFYDGIPVDVVQLNNKQLKLTFNSSELEFFDIDLSNIATATIGNGKDDEVQISEEVNVDGSDSLTLTFSKLPQNYNSIILENYYFELEKINDEWIAYF